MTRTLSKPKREGQSNNNSSMPKAKKQRPSNTSSSTSSNPKTVELRPLRVCTKEEAKLSERLDRVEQKLDKLHVELTQRLGRIEELLRAFNRHATFNDSFTVGSLPLSEASSFSNEYTMESTATEAAPLDPQAITLDSSPQQHPRQPLPQPSSSSEPTIITSNIASSSNDIIDGLPLPLPRPKKKRRSDRKPIIIPADPTVVPAAAASSDPSSLPTPTPTPSPDSSSSSPQPPSIPYYPIDFNIITVTDIWQEWDVGLKQRSVPLKTLEEYYGDSWCHTDTMRFTFAQRKYIIEEIMRLADQKGISYQEAAQELEMFRLRNTFDLADLAAHIRQHRNLVIEQGQ